jgi:hypothetical protein
MFGKAVKFRHCPATVSAPVSVPVLYEASEQDRISAKASSFDEQLPFMPLKLNPFGSALGRRLENA